jgi:ferric-dicitrate binding protein FerR (iron transport regulator)
MSEREEEDARLAQQALRGLRSPSADAAFRARLRASFADGSLAHEAPSSAAPGLARPLGHRRPLFARPRTWLVAAGAAAVLAVYAGIALNPGPHWQVASLQNAHGNVLVDDDAIPADDAASLTDALLPGSTIEWNGDGELMLISPGQLALSIAPGTRMTLPPPPPRFFARVSQGRIEAGRVRVTTGPGFHGARAEFRTPEAMAIVTGTTLAVIRDAMATCVCVSEGRVHVMAMASSARGTRAGAGRDFGMVPAGERQVVYRAEPPKEPERTPILPTEREPLAALRTAMAPRWHEPSPAR